MNHEWEEPRLPGSEGLEIQLGRLGGKGLGRRTVRPRLVRGRRARKETGRPVEPTRVSPPYHPYPHPAPNVHPGSSSRVHLATTPGQTGYLDPSGEDYRVPVTSILVALGLQETSRPKSFFFFHINFKQVIALLPGLHPTYIQLVVQICQALLPFRGPECVCVGGGGATHRHLLSRQGQEATLNLYSSGFRLKMWFNPF